MKQIESGIMERLTAHVRAAVEHGFPVVIYPNGKGRTDCVVFSSNVVEIDITQPLPPVSSELLELYSANALD